MTNILFINSLGTTSKGCVAVQTGCIRSIKASLPDAKITIWSTRPDSDKAYEEMGVKICQHPWLQRKKSLLVSLLLSLSHLIKALTKRLVQPQKDNNSYDVLVSLNMDGFNDRQYGMIFVLQGLINSFFSILILNKPIILIPASIGPYKSNICKFVTRYVLNKFNVVVVRGEKSLEYIQQIKINKPKTLLLADLGFLLPTSSYEKTSVIMHQENITIGERLIVGFSPSIEMGLWAFPKIKNRSIKKERYIKLMADIADYIIEKYGALICFIPNVEADPYTKESADTLAAQNIISYMKHPDYAKTTSDAYSASEIKGIISRCHIFFSCRMHSAIASTSTAVPTVVMAYGTKFDDVIIGTMGQANCYVRIEDNPEEINAALKQKINYIWENHALIREELKIKSKLADNSALEFGKLIKPIININEVP